MILFGITAEHQPPLCDDCLVRWTVADPDQPEEEAA